MCVDGGNRREAEEKQMGRLRGSVGKVSDFGSGRDLAVHGFESRVRLCADSSEPGACFRFCISLALCPSPAHALSLSVSLSKINIKKLNNNNKKKRIEADGEVRGTDRQGPEMKTL